MPNQLNQDGIIESSGDHPLIELVEKLGAVSWQLRRESAEKISTYGEEAVPHLIRCLNTGNDDQRFWSMVALCKISTDLSLKPVLKLARIKDDLIRSYAAIALGHARHPDVIPLLLQLLNDNDWRVCNNSVNSLVMQGKSVIDPLIETLKTASYNAAFWITKALSRLGDDGIEVLIAFSRFKSKNIRMLVTEALGESQHPAAIKALFQLLKDEHWMVRENAVDALIREGGNIIEPLIFFLKSEKENMLPFVEKVFSGMGEYRITPLVNLLKHEDREIRILSADALGKTQSCKAVKPLIEALKDKVWLVRKAAAKAISQIGSGAVEELLKSLDEKDENVRFWVATILGEIGEKSIDPLIQMLQSGDRDSKFYAAQALGKIRNEKVVLNLVNALQDECWAVRNKVSESLINLGDVCLVPVMKSLMSQNEDRRFWSRKVIEVIGPQELDQICEILVNSRDSEMRYFAAYTISLVGNDSCLPYLVSASLNDTNEWVRKYSITALSRIRNQQALNILVKLLSDGEEEIAYWAARSFANMGEMAAETLRPMLDDPELHLSNLALLALGGIGDPESVSRIIDRMSESGPAADRYVTVLVSCGVKAAGQLAAQLGSTRRDLRENCARALLKIGEPAVSVLTETLENGNQEAKNQAARLIREIRKTDGKKIRN